MRLDGRPIVVSAPARLRSATVVRGSRAMARSTSWSTAPQVTSAADDLWVASNHGSSCSWGIQTG